MNLLVVHFSLLFVCVTITIAQFSLEQHYVSKCCPVGLQLGVQGSGCAEGVDEPPPTFPPPYTVKFKDKYLEPEQVVVTQGDFINTCRKDTVEVYGVELLSSDGRFLADGNSTDWRHYDCVDYILDRNYTAVVAVQCSTVPHLGCLEDSCVKKCCPFGYSLSSSGCEERSDLETEILLDPLNITQVDANPEKVRVKTNFYGLLTNYNSSTRGWECEDVYLLYADEVHYITNNGSLHHRTYNEVTDIYCADYFPAENNTWNMQVVRCVHSIKEDIQYLDDPAYRDKRIMRLVHIVLISISLVAILFTLLVYLILPDLRNLHGKIIISNLVAIGLVSLFLISTYSVPLDTVSHQLCTGMGYIGYFSIMSMMIWMTTMCFDLCWTFFRAKIPTHSSDNKKFVLYSLFSWGLPLLGTVLLLVFQLYLPSSSLLNPRIGDFRGECFVARSGNRIRLLLIAPIAVIIIVNVVLFLAIVLTLFISKSKTSGIRTSTRRDHGSEEGRVTRRTKEQLKLYAKLFLIIGLLWGGESVHQLNHYQEQNHLQADGNRTEWNYENKLVSHLIYTQYDLCKLNDPWEIFYRLLDCLNLLRGLFLFLIFVCKRNIYTKLKNKLMKQKNRGMLTESRRVLVISKPSADLSKGTDSLRNRQVDMVAQSRNKESATMSAGQRSIL